MSKKIQLLVSEWCPTCPQAERLWLQVATETGAELEVLDVAKRPGRDIVSSLMIRTVPAAVIDGKLSFVGTPEPEAARNAMSGWN